MMKNIEARPEKNITLISSRALEQQLKEMRHNLQELEKNRLEQENERLTYKKLLDAAPDAIVFVDRQGKILRVNAQLESVFGYEEGELDGKNIKTLIPSRFHTKHRSHLRNFFAHPRQRPMGTQYEIFGRKKDGREFPADISLNFLKIDGIPYASASVRDITERKAIDDKLIRDVHMQRVISEVLKIALKQIPLQEQLDSILELILSVPVLFLEEKGAIYLLNEDRKSMSLAAVRGFDEKEELPCREIIFGMCLCGEAAGKCKTVYADQLDDRHRLIRDDMFSHGHYCVPIIENNECVGLLNLYVKEGHKRNGSEEKFITVIADTTALVIRHHRNEKEKFRLQEQLAEDEKMAALGRMAANFAHQIRNPLTTIGGLAKRLAGLQIGKRGLKYATSINTEAIRLELTLNNMFSYIKPPALNPEKHNIAAILEESLQGFSQIIEEHSVEVRKDYQQVPELLLDRKLISLVLVNLLANALEAMPDSGGRLSLTIAGKGEGKESKVTVEVRDSGPGIPPDVMQTIFEPFYTTKVGEKKGGLGLTTSKKILEDHHGAIELISRRGNGTAVILTLPVNPA
ncbi:MAG: PAS domain S-box protein [Desulfobulbaceae bacterium]|nr:PAS domain S-box protein [Desulfobulbaceae bacterium]